MTIMQGRTIAAVAAAAMLVSLPLSAAQANGGRQAEAIALGLVGGALLGSVVAAQGGTPVYQAPPVVYQAPPPVVYQPAPTVVYAPPPAVVYQAAPVYAVPAYPYVYHRAPVGYYGGYYRHY